MLQNDLAMVTPNFVKITQFEISMFMSGYIRLCDIKMFSGILQDNGCCYRNNMRKF